MHTLSPALGMSGEAQCQRSILVYEAPGWDAAAFASAAVA